MVPAVRHNIVFVVFIFAHFLASASRGSRRRTFSLAGQRRGGRKVCSRVIFFEENATAGRNCLLHDLRKLVGNQGNVTSN